jgi:hypothetical protein
VATAVATASLLFKIDGWSVREELATDRAALVDSAKRASAPDEMWLTISQSWRTAWR